MTGIRIDTVLTGRARPFGPKGQPSAIAKRPITGPVAIGRDGLDGDEQGDRRHHGGPEKAVHHYAFDHYPFWRAALPQTAELLSAPGAFGENLSSSGLTEGEVCIGDVFALGTARLQVSQGRQPCWKLGRRFGDPAMPRRVQDSGRTGWYYRVLDPGTAAPGDPLVLLDRPAPDWTVARILDVLYRDCLNRPALAAIAGLEELAEGWRRLAQRRLDSMAVEDWAPRLQEPA